MEKEETPFEKDVKRLMRTRRLTEEQAKQFLNQQAVDIAVHNAQWMKKHANTNSRTPGNVA